MFFIADLHIHSKYSRATSKNMDLDNLDKWAKIKGIKVLGTGDFTHPEWFRSLKERLIPAESGLFKLKNNSGTRFLLTSEISCIYSKNNQVRKVHILIFSPSFDIVEKINTQLSWIGNLKSDGRPILGLDAKELAKIVLDSSKDCFIIPAHCMTPWFAVFGSKSGFDSLEECFEEYSQNIYSMETGLSADPEMLWRIPDGRRVSLISNSDAHSPAKIGREANVFNSELSYSAITEAIKQKNKEKFLYTIEFFPQEGKYHFDGHRNCDLRLSPKESKKYNNICPNCGKPLTLGVLNRVEQLADKESGFKPERAIPFKSLIPLEEIIAEAVNQNTGTKAVSCFFQNMIEKFGSEFEILLNTSKKEIENFFPSEIAEAIIRVREGRVRVEPGYDGVFGKIRIFSQEEKKDLPRQKPLF